MYDIKNVNIGKLFRKYRKLKHLSLDYVGEKVFKNKATISKYEKGKIIPDFITVLEICNVLDINVSNIVPFISPIYEKPSLFDTNTLYLYYLTGKKLITSTIMLEYNNNACTAYFYNGIKENTSKSAYFYEGTVTYSETVTYMNFKNSNSNKLKMEEVQITISQPLSNATKYYNCFISGLTPNFVSIVKKGILSTTQIIPSEALTKKLRVSKEELKKISDNNAWLLNSQLYDEFFYDF